MSKNFDLILMLKITNRIIDAGFKIRSVSPQKIQYRRDDWIIEIVPDSIYIKQLKTDTVKSFKNYTDFSFYMMNTVRRD